MSPARSTRSSGAPPAPREPPSLGAVVGSAVLFVLVLFVLVWTLAGHDQHRVVVPAPDGGAVYVEVDGQPARCIVAIDTDAPVLHARLDWCIDPVEYPMR